MKAGTALESVLAGFRKDEMIAFVENNPEVYSEIIDLSLSDKPALAWRAAWLLCVYMQPNDTHIVPYIDAMLKSITSKKDGHKREFLKILLKMKLNEEQELQLFDICLEIWQQAYTQPSVRSTAIKTMLKIIERQPLLLNELKPLLQEHYLQTLSHGVRCSVKRMMSNAKISME